jgi:uncharacterized protein
MRLASQFAVPAAPDKVFAMFFDPETMRACIPGCEELRRVDDTHYAGKLVNEVAHVKFTAGFTAEIQSVSEPTSAGEQGKVHALLKGEDRRLGSTIKLDAAITVSPQGEESLVAYEFDMAMWGKLGRLGEPVIRRRTVEVQKQFAEAIAAVASGRPVPAAGAGSRKAQPTAAPAVAPAPPAPVAPAATEAPPGRSRDMPFVVAVAAAAFAFGVILGGLGRRR